MSAPYSDTQSLPRRSILLTVALLLTWAGVAMAAPQADAAKRCNGYEDLCNRPFSETVFAGTHNSMAADDYDWSSLVTTQRYSIGNQLRLGIRALSFDIHYGESTTIGGIEFVDNADGPTRPGVKPYLCHEVCLLGAMPLEDGLEEVVDFLEENPREVLTIFVEDYISPEDLETVLISSGLMEHVYEGPMTTTLGEMIESGKRVFMFSQNRGGQKAWYPYLNGDLGRISEYRFGSTDDLTDTSNHWATCDKFPWASAGTGRFYLLQHFVTIGSTGDEEASAVVNQRDVLLSRALRCKDRQGVLPSILLVDYFEFGDVLGATRQLNDLYVDEDPPSAELGNLTLEPASRVVQPGRTYKLEISIENSGGADGRTDVQLWSSKAAVTTFRTVRMTVPAGSTTSRIIGLRVSGQAKGRVTLSASAGDLHSRLSLKVKRP